MRRIFVCLWRCYVGHIASYVTEVATPKANKKTGKIGGLFIACCLSYEPSKFVLDTVLEFNGEWHDREETNGKKDGNSGGNIVYISPGLRFAAEKNVNLRASFGIPIIQDTHGYQVEPNYRVITSINFSF